MTGIRDALIQRHLERRQRLGLFSPVAVVRGDVLRAPQPGPTLAKPDRGGRPGRTSGSGDMPRIPESARMIQEIVSRATKVPVADMKDRMKCKGPVAVAKHVARYCCYTMIRNASLSWVARHFVCDHAGVARSFRMVKADPDRYADLIAVVANAVGDGGADGQEDVATA